jgi:hypothetical protein
VVLHGEFAVGALDLHLSRFAGDTEDFVVIAFYVAGQNFSFLFKPIPYLSFRSAVFWREESAVSLSRKADSSSSLRSSSE